MIKIKLLYEYWTIRPFLRTFIHTYIGNTIYNIKETGKQKDTIVFA